MDSALKETFTRYALPVTRYSLESIFSIIIGYLFGSIPFAYISGKLFGKIDIRKHGTRNVGTLNVFEVLGRYEALFTLVGDVGKGAASVFTARYLGVNEATIMLSAFAAIVGHDWPIWLKFYGGKGLATTIGVTLALFPLGLMFVGIIYAILFFPLKRHSPLINVLSFLLLPFFCWFLGKSLLMMLGFSAIVFLRMFTDYNSWHRDLVELFAGRPHKPGKRFAASTPSLWEKRNSKN